MPWNDTPTQTGLMTFDLGPTAYGTAQSVAATAQRNAMHVGARGFHGLSELAARRTARKAIRVPRKTVVFTAKRQRVLRKVRRTGRERPMGMSAEPLYGDALAGSYDGLGATYGARTRLKAKRGVPLSPGERAWLARDRSMRRVAGSRRQARVARSKTGARFFTPSVGMSDCDTGLGAKKRSKWKTALRVTRGAIGFKKGLTASEIKASRKVRKAGIIGGAGVLLVASGATGRIVGEIAKKVGPGAMKAGSGVLKAGKSGQALTWATRLKGIREKVSMGRKALGLPAIKLKGRAAKKVDEAEARATAAVEGGSMTPEQGAAYVENATQEATREQAQESVTSPAPMPRGPVTDGSSASASYEGAEPETGAAPSAGETTVTGESSAPAKKGGMGMGLAVAAAVVGLMLMQGRKR